MIFNQIWNMQHELNKVIGKDTVFADNKEEFLFMYCEALSDEIIELMDCYYLTFNKPNKYIISENNYKNAKIEAVDCLHFLMSIFHILDVKDFECDGDPFIEYYSKMKKELIEVDYLIIYKNIINFIKMTAKIKNRTNWKWWSKSVKDNPTTQYKLIVKKEHIKDECISAFICLLNIFYHLKMSPDDILYIYREKCKINHERQKNDYDVKTKTENDNLELEKHI